MANYYQNGKYIPGEDPRPYSALTPEEQAIRNGRPAVATPPPPSVPNPGPAPITPEPIYRNPALNEPAFNPIAPDREAIRQQKLKAARERAAVVEKEFATKINSETQAGEGRNARTRALNISSGLGGSNFASSNAQKTEDFNRDQMNLLEEEKAARITAVLADAEDEASRDYNEQRQNYLQEYQISAQEKAERVKVAVDRILALGANGADLTKFKTQEKQVYDYLVKASGLSPMEVDYKFEAAKPKAEQVDYKDIYTPTADGKTQLYRYGVDKKGNLVEHNYTIDAPYSQFATEKKPLIVDGVPYFPDPKNPNGLIKATGFQSKPREGTQTERDRFTITQQITSAKPQLEQSRKGGQFYDGNEYLRLRSEFVQKTGDASAFDEAFRPFLSPQDRAKYGIGGTTGVPSVEKPADSGFDTAHTTIQTYKDNGFTRDDIESQYEDASVSIPLEVQKALDEIYGK